MKSLDERFREREEADRLAAAQETKTRNAEAKLAIELASHVETFCGARGIRVETGVDAGQLTITKRTGEKMLCRPVVEIDHGDFYFHVEAANIGPAQLDEDQTLDAILDWLRQK